MSPADQFLVPEYLDGKATFVPYAGDIQERIKKGAPEFGWEGDERLYLTPRDGAEGYALGRLNEDGTKSLICTSEAPHKLDQGILIWLAEHDTRHVDVYQRVEDNNARKRKEHEDTFKEHLAEVYDRTVHALIKANGHEH